MFMLLKCFCCKTNLDRQYTPRLRQPNMHLLTSLAAPSNKHNSRHGHKISLQRILSGGPFFPHSVKSSEAKPLN